MFCGSCTCLTGPFPVIAFPHVLSGNELERKCLDSLYECDIARSGCERKSDQSWVASTRKLGKSPPLDGLRGIAWSLVFLGHVQPLSFLDPADTGMFIFFALSGFLITQLAVSEFAVSGRINFAAFLRRRLVRLLPALVVFLSAWFLVAAFFMRSPWLTTVPQGGPSRTMHPLGAIEGIAASIGYVMNWIEIFHLFSGYVPIGHIWSLAVEMQFYLLWVSALMVLLRFGRRAALWAAACGSILASVEVILLVNAGAHGLRIYMGTDTRMGALLGGAAAALIWSNADLNLKNSKILSLLAFTGVATICWSAYAFGEPAHSVPAQLVWPLTAAAVSAVVFYLVDRPWTLLGRLSSGRTIRYIGRRSYALYLWHYVWLTWFRDLGLLGVVAGFGMSLVSAELSWRFVEQPAARWSAPNVSKEGKCERSAQFEVMG